MFEDKCFQRIWQAAKPHTMTSPERGYALYSAVNYLIANKIHGAFVECGVWRGGSAMIILMALKELGNVWRDVILFDTFEGMTEPGALDLDHSGRTAEALLGANPDERERSLVQACASEEEVRANIALCDYPLRRIRLVKGDVRETLRQTQTGTIALLRLDTDFHDSTRAELEELYPRVHQGGVVLIDDYGHWQGCRAAVDGYFEEHATEVRQPLLHAIDYTGRVLVKQEPATKIDIERYDYVPPGLEDPCLLPYFENLKESDPTKVKWPYLRYRAPHVWRVDGRSTAPVQIGVLSYEEAILVFNLARQFSGCRALEIGCHFGWASSHLVAAGLDLDIIDPALGQQARVEALTSTLEQMPGQRGYRLWAGFSPSIVPAVRVTRKEPWSLVMIDGNHEGEAPKLDALAIAEHCADDAMVIFHDLTSPAVAEGLRALKNMGWSTQLYNTMQIIGVAWRGNVQLVPHAEDPNIPMISHGHLTEFHK
jgi:hypothetical protein